MLIHVAGLSWVGEELEGTAAWALGGALTYGSRWAVIVFVMASGALLLTPPADPDPDGSSAAGSRRWVSRCSSGTRPNPARGGALGLDPA